ALYYHQSGGKLLNLWRRDLIIPCANRPPINWTTYSLPNSYALQFTRLRKNQLLLHLHIPNIIITAPSRYRFTSEETLIADCLPNSYCFWYAMNGSSKVYIFVSVTK
ncbi:MAG: hypothetical protein ACK53Y_22970, partial [bacterium]